MVKLSILEIIERIENEEIFHAVVDDYSFSIKIDDYVPYACAAINNGHHFSQDLRDNCLLNIQERWYEEDPSTGQMIAGLPITLIALDSRFEYDLNRHPQDAIYETAWGKNVWRKPLNSDQHDRSIRKHDNFYKVVLTLMVKLEELFGSTVFYDLHSYNYKRWDRVVPVFNIGTSNVDKEKYGTAITQWQDILDGMSLPIDQKVVCKINDVFEGNGYFSRYITANSLNSLVLTTHVAKIYCNETSGKIYPEVVHSIQDLFKYYIKAHAHRFYDRHDAY